MTHSDLSRCMSEGTHPISRRAQLFTAVAVLLIFAVLAAIAAPGAGAITDEEELTRFGSFGSGAGQLYVPGGIGADPTTGHAYIADEGNNRISEFTAWGNFVKAFGWDVAPGAVNEQQEVRVRAAGGQFRLSFKGEETIDLAFNAPGSESEGPGSVEAALNALPTIGGASVSAVPGTPDGNTPYIYVVAFKGSLAGTNVAQLTATPGTTALSGGVPTNTLDVRTRAEGTAGGTGLESCTTESGCKVGLQGAGAGQFHLVTSGVAVDANGNLYVTDIRENHRVQKFDSAGRFLLTFGGEVDKTTKADICTAASGDECGIGIVGTGPGRFAAGNHPGIAIGAGGALFVADNERIQRFNLEGEFQASIPIPGKSVDTLAFDPVSGDLYANFESENNIHKLDSTTGEEIGELKTFNGSGPPATDPAGNVFAPGEVGAVEGVGGKDAVLQFDSEGKPLSPSSCCSPESPFSIQSIGTNAAGDLYVANRVAGGINDNFIRLFGPGPVIFEAPPKVSPSIVGEFASSVERDSATVAAEINPHFWTNTRYYVQYGTGKCSEGGCDLEKPLAPGSILTTKVFNSPVRSDGISLEGLKPGTTYHYRFIAQSSGGGPVEGEERTFITYPVAAPPKSDCPNQVFRTGFSAPLPDCRAFEMVSPVDKNGGDIQTLFNITPTKARLSQSALDGERFTYTSYRSFGDSKSAPYVNQYMAARDPQGGWSSEAIDVAQGSHFTGGFTFENRYKAFTADLCSGWLMARAEPAPAPGATPGYNSIYRRDGCGGEAYEALIQTKPGNLDFTPLLQGTSADGGEAILFAEDIQSPKLVTGPWLTYYASRGELHLLCVLPDGTPAAGNCSAGTSKGDEHLSGLQAAEREASLTHAISSDGSKVYWTSPVPKIPVTLLFLTGPGKIYLRLNPGEEQSQISGGECTEAEKACTIRVSETASNKPSRFLGASADGSKALFEITEGTQEGSLYVFDLETASSTLLAAKGLGVAGMSEDLSHIYFASEEALPGTVGATAGEPNLYLDREGTKTFITTLSNEELSGVSTIFNPLSFDPLHHAARATPDGNHLAFVSNESFTGYDNTDQASGKPDSEVYLYEAGSAGPVCVSCNPSGARPQGRFEVVGGRVINATASSLAMPLSPLYFPRVLSGDGQRLFFNSFDPLLPRDTNGKADVYEWEAAGGPEDCREKGAELYVASSGGCLSLISTGESPQDAEFLDASAGGGDAFFTTNAGLLPQDPGLFDVYDAREGGGLPAPPAPPGPCQGEACQFAPPPPNDPTPASASFKGAGNPKPRPRCRKGKVARKGRCVARKQKHAKKRRHKREINHNRGANR